MHCQLGDAAARVRDGRGAAASAAAAAAAAGGGVRRETLTSLMNFLQMGRISLLSVAENIMTCLSCGVILKMSCTSPRMSADRKQACRQPRLCHCLRGQHVQHSWKR